MARARQTLHLHLLRRKESCGNHEAHSGDSDHHLHGEPITGRREAARVSNCGPWCSTGGNGPRALRMDAPVRSGWQASWTRRSRMASPGAGFPVHDTAAAIIEQHEREGAGGDIETGESAPWAGAEPSLCTIALEPGTLRRGDIVSERLADPDIANAPPAQGQKETPYVRFDTTTETSMEAARHLSPGPGIAWQHSAATQRNVHIRPLAEQHLVH